MLHLMLHLMLQSGLYCKNFFYTQNPWLQIKSGLYFIFTKYDQYLPALFIILVNLTMTCFREKMLIYTRCTSGFMPNLFKKSATVSNAHIFVLKKVSSELRFTIANPIKQN